jgi:DNA repair protein RadC
MTTGADKKNHAHQGHRQRKKEQFLKSGIEHLPEHEPLEFLLYYAIPRGDTNETAHALIKKFGSFSAVVNASYEELLTVKGIGENAASLICFSKMFSQLYLKNNAETKMKKLNSSDSIKDFCSAIFAGATEEEFHCLYFTDNLNLIEHEKICAGKLGEVDIPIRKITRSILKNNCSSLVITHNHPSGSCMPSRADIDSTNAIRNIFSGMEVALIDHIIIGRDGALSMKEMNAYNS